MFDFDRLKIVARFIDDMEAIKADLESNNNELQYHALGRLATIAAEQADLAEKLPHVGPRFASLLLGVAEDALANRAGIERCRRINDEHRKAWARQDRIDELRREKIEETHRRVGQGDMFASPALKDTE